MLLSHIYIADTLQKGRGMFTTQAIEAGQIVEVAPVVVMCKADRIHLDKTLLHHYIFEWEDGNESCAMALGMVPIYNHNYTSNCDYDMDYSNQTIIIKAVRDIDEGEELCINYNGQWNDETPIWFDAV